MRVKKKRSLKLIHINESKKRKNIKPKQLKVTHLSQLLLLVNTCKHTAQYEVNIFSRNSVYSSCLDEMSSTFIRSTKDLT